MMLCIAVCAYEGTNTFSSIVIMVLGDEDFLSVLHTNGITSKVAVVLRWSWFQGYLLVCGGVHNWQTSYQVFGWVWILSGPSVDGAISRRLLSMMALGQGYGSTIYTLVLVGSITKYTGGYSSHKVPGCTFAGLLAGPLSKEDWHWTVAEMSWNQSPGMF